ncbi:MAG: hypothetical protein ACTHN4_09265 [Sphingomicrobium sp.]
MKIAKLALPLLVLCAGALPSAAQASTLNSSIMSQIRGHFVWPTSWYNCVGLFRGG